MLLPPIVLYYLQGALSLWPSQHETPVHWYDEREYSMKNGRVVIFSQETFLNFPPRNGSKMDVLNLRNILPRFGCDPNDTNIYYDLDYLDVLETIENVSKANYTDYDWLLVFVLTHGGNGEVLHFHDTYGSTTEIWSPFTGDKIPTLYGKPKLFFFIACRGEDSDKQPLKKTQRQGRSDELSVAAHSDILLIYSTVPGHVSLRYPIRGTWYISAFSWLGEQLRTDDKISFTDFLTDVNRAVAHKYVDGETDFTGSVHRYKQSPVFSSALTKRLHVTVQHNSSP